MVRGSWGRGNWVLLSVVRSFLEVEQDSPVDVVERQSRMLVSIGKREMFLLISDCYELTF